MFVQKFNAFACVNDTITCEVDGFTATATIYHDEMTAETPAEHDDGFWPSRDKTAAGYVPPDRFDAEMAKAERAMTAWKNDEWFYCGVAVTIERNGVPLTHKYGAALWGIECNYPDSDNAYLLEIANELLPEALAEAKATRAKLCA